MAKKTGSIDWKALEKKQGTIVSTGSGANVIELAQGEFFIGKFTGTEEISIGDKDPFTSLQFETEKGNQCISGVQLVQNMRMINKGSIVKVTRMKAKKSASGNKVGQFNIELLDGTINEKERDAIKKEIQEAMKNKKKKTTKKGKK